MDNDMTAALREKARGWLKGSSFWGDDEETVDEIAALLAAERAEAVAEERRAFEDGLELLSEVADRGCNCDEGYRCRECRAEEFLEAYDARARSPQEPK